MANAILHSRIFSLCITLLLLRFSPFNLVSARPGKSCRGFRTAFSFSDFSSDIQKLTLFGDAQLRGTGLQISGSKAQSAGGAFYSQPVRLSNPVHKGESMSFSTFFSFSMDASKGDGLAFVIAPSKVFNGVSGPWFGLSDGLLPLPHTMAIEFDTFKDAEVQDPSENHVGFDLESLVSLATADVSDGFSLSDGEKLYAWIDYNALFKVLEVRLSRSQAERPENYILSYKVDLANVWQEEMFVGFSSSTGNTPQRHVVYSWSFITQDPFMWKRFRPGFFGPHGPHDQRDGPRRDWHRGPGDWHHGPHDWHHGPVNWHHEGFPYWPEQDRPHEWHSHHHGDASDSWFDGLSDVWGVVISILIGAMFGAVAAGAMLLVWHLVCSRCMQDSSDAKQDLGILYGYQKISVPESDVKADSKGYQKLPTTEA